MTGSYLEEPPVSPEVRALYDDDLKDDGYVSNATRLWAHLAFSTINDAFGAQPDAQLALSLPPEVREAVTFGRPVAT